jgi:hypothetical protein
MHPRTRPGLSEALAAVHSLIVVGDAATEGESSAVLG